MKEGRETANVCACGHDEERIAQAIDEWYSPAWNRGVRLTSIERERLGRYLAQRLGLATKNGSTSEDR